MESAFEKRPVQSPEFSIQDGENDNSKWHRQFCLLSYKLENYSRGVDEADKLCERAKKELETLRIRLRENYEIIEQNAARKIKIISALIEVKKKLKMELENAARTLEEIISEEQQSASSYEASAWVCLCIKTGCALLCNIVTAYALFRITQFFF